MKQSLASNGRNLLIVTFTLALLVIGLLLLDNSRQRDTSADGQMRLFQRTIGGLGMGAAATPAWNVLHYDPRLQSVDDSNLWPVPGAYPYSPVAASTAANLKEIPREDLRLIRIE